MKIVIITDRQVEQGGTNEITKHIVKALSPNHDITIRSLIPDQYMPKLFPKKWQSIYRILYLRRISKERQFDQYDMIITLQPDSHCIKHRNHLVYFQHHMRQYYDLFRISLCQRKKIRKKIAFLILTSLARFADNIFLIPNLRASHVLVNSKTVGLRLVKYNKFSSFDIVNPGCAVPQDIPSKIQYISVGQEDRSGQTILAFSRLELIQKGIDLIMDVALLTPCYNFIIAGPCCDSKVNDERRNIPNLTFVIKNFSDEEKDLLYRNCDVFLAPYIDEDFGITPLEANSYGKPVVYCKDSGEIVYTQSHKTTGYMCSRNPTSLIKGIKFCLSNRERMKPKCILNASQYTWSRFENCIRKHVENITPKR